MISMGPIQFFQLKKMPLCGISIDDELLLDYQKFIVRLSSGIDQLAIGGHGDFYVARGLIAVDFF